MGLGVQIMPRRPAGLDYDKVSYQGLSQDLETGCPKLAIVKLLGFLFFKGEHTILRLQHKNVYDH